MSKRLMASRLLQRTGLLRLLESLPSRPGILIVNHHRIGEASLSRFDRGVFSQTEAGLSEQISLLRKRMPIVCGEELERLVYGKTKLTRMYAAVTFDDGYLDNYTAALPVLQAHSCPAIFFLVTRFVGSASIPWWDQIAYLVRNTAAELITLTIPAHLTVTIGGDRELAIRTILSHYKREDNVDGELLLAELRSQTGCTLPTVDRRFLSWEEAAEMQAAGMTIGSHTCTHPVLSQLPVDKQRWELEESRAELRRRMHGQPCSFLAYPVGRREAFTAETEEISTQAGYSLAFAFQGGMNEPFKMKPTHLSRCNLAVDPSELRTELAMLSAAGRLPF